MGFWLVLFVGVAFGCVALSLLTKTSLLASYRSFLSERPLSSIAPSACLGGRDRLTTCTVGTCDFGVRDKCGKNPVMSSGNASGRTATSPGAAC